MYVLSVKDLIKKLGILWEVDFILILGVVVIDMNVSGCKWDCYVLFFRYLIFVELGNVILIIFLVFFRYLFVDNVFFLKGIVIDLDVLKFIC